MGHWGCGIGECLAWPFLGEDWPAATVTLVAGKEIESGGPIDPAIVMETDRVNGSQQSFIDAQEKRDSLALVVARRLAVQSVKQLPGFGVCPRGDAKARTANCWCGTVCDAGSGCWGHCYVRQRRNRGILKGCPIVADRFKEKEHGQREPC